MRWMAVAFAMAAGTAFAQDTKLSDKEIAAWDSVQQELVEVWRISTLLRPARPELKTLVKMI